jgi:hypothetical protein
MRHPATAATRAITAIIARAPSKSTEEATARSVAVTHANASKQSGRFCRTATREAVEPLDLQILQAKRPNKDYRAHVRDLDAG